MLSHIILGTGILALLVVTGWVVDRIRRASRTKVVRAWGFPHAWLPFLPDTLPFYGEIPYDLQEKFQEKLFFKLNDLAFDGYGAFEQQTDQQRMIAAGPLALLHALQRIPPISAIRQIVIVTPAMAQAAEAEPNRWGEADHVVIWDPEMKAFRHVREERDPEIMAHWRALRPESAASERDGDKLIFAAYGRSLVTDLDRRVKDFLGEDSALATDRALAAAASEAFVRYPHHLKQTRPDLFNALRLFYGIDPSRWRKKTGPAVRALAGAGR